MAAPAKFTEDSRLPLTTGDVPSWTETAPIIGESSIHTLEELKARREQEVAFLLAKLVLEKYFQDGEGNVKAWLFPQVLGITRQWMGECLVCKDNTFPQMVWLAEYRHNAADKIYRSIAASEEGEKRLLPILRPYDTVGSTGYVDFDTIRPVYPTRPDRCHISHVVADTESWEQKLAQALEEMEEVDAYAKNEHLGFTIPYTIDGEERNYLPDFVVRWRDPQGEHAGPEGGHTGPPLHVILEVTGERKKDKEAKVATARRLWVPAVNNHGGFGLWAFVEVRDPWDAKHLIRAALAGLARTQ